MTRGRQWIGLAIWIALCLGAGGLGAAITTTEINGWYRTIIKPTWNPPDSVFWSVWTALYLMMAVSAWLVWRPAGLRAAAAPLTLFGIQLVLNSLWSWIIFGMHQIGWAVIEIIVLWAAILATTVAFFRRSKPAGWLLVPYPQTSTIQVVTPPFIDAQGMVWTGSGSGGSAGSRVGPASVIRNSSGELWWVSNYRNIYGAMQPRRIPQPTALPLRPFIPPHVRILRKRRL